MAKLSTPFATVSWSGAAEGAWRRCELEKTHELAQDHHDRAVYAHAYEGSDAVRASTAWYKAIHQDVGDMKTYPKPTMPVPTTATDVRFVEVEKSQHRLAEDAPEPVSRSPIEFFA